MGEYGKDYMKIKFDSADNLPLNKILSFVYWQLLSKTFLKTMVNTMHNFFR